MDYTMNSDTFYRKSYKLPIDEHSYIRVRPGVDKNGVRIVSVSLTINMGLTCESMNSARITMGTMKAYQVEHAVRELKGAMDEAAETGIGTRATIPTRESRVGLNVHFPGGEREPTLTFVNSYADGWTKLSKRNVADLIECLKQSAGNERATNRKLEPNTNR